MNEELKVIISAEVAKFKKGMSEAKAELTKFKDQVKNVDTSTIDANFQKLGSSISSAMKIGAASVAAFVAALAGIALGTAQTQADLAALNASFTQAGLSADTASSTMSRLYGVIGETDQAVEASQQIALLANSEQEAAKWAELASGVMGTFSDALQPETFYEAANETLKLGEATGAFVQMLEGTGVMSVEEFNAALAACTTEEEKQALMLEVSQKAMGEAGEAWDSATQKLQEQRQAQLEMETALADVGAAVSPVVTAFMSFASDALAACTPYLEDIANNLAPTLADVLSTVASALADAFNWASQHKTLLMVIGGIILTVVTAITLYNVVAAVKAAMAVAEVTTVWGLVAAYTAQAAAMLVALAPYLLIAAAIAAVIAIIVICITHWDEIKAKVLEVAEAIKTKVQEMKDKVVNFFTELASKIKNKVEEIKTNAKNKFEEIKTAITEKIQAAKQAVVDKFNEIKSKIQETLEKAKQIVTTVVTAIYQAFKSYFELVKSIVTTVFNTVYNHIKSKIELAKTIVSNVLSAIKSIFSGDLEGAKQSVINIFNAIKDHIEDKINEAKDKVDDAIQKVKDIMNFEWEIPKPKIPKFSVSGGKAPWGFGGKGSLPKISVSWAAKGGIFDSPTLFGFGGHLGGLGEDGAEAIVPLEKNLGWLDKLAGMLDERMSGGATTLILQVDGKTFGEVTIDNINKITRQTGNLPLVMA